MTVGRPGVSAPRGALAAILVAGALALAGCGFHLRGVSALPFDKLYITTAPASPLGAQLRRSIRIGTSTRLVEEAPEAQAVLDVSGEAKEKEVISYNAQGQAREYELRYRLVIRVHDNKGYEYLPSTIITAARDIAYNDSLVLAEETQETLLYQDMQSDLVQQVLRRLAAIQPKPANAGPS